MFQKIIKNIRAKPEPVRRGITLGVSLGLTSIVAFFWFISFLNYSNQVLTAKPKVESPTSFLNKMSTIIGESYANVRTKMSAGPGFVRGNLNIEDATASTSDASSTDSDDNEAFATTSDEIFSETQSENTTDTSENSTDTSNDTSDVIEPKQSNDGSSKSLNDILNTKKQVKQDEEQSGKATTSSEVLVQ